MVFALDAKALSGVTGLILAILVVVPVLFSQDAAFAEDVIFVVPGSSDPRSVVDFDPLIQKIAPGQSIVFVNADGVEHQLAVKSEDNEEVFNTGPLARNEFVSHAFSEAGEYTLECKIYSHMRGMITVTEDIATFTKTIEDQNLEVELSRSPANPGVGDEIFYKITFIDTQTGRNRPHIDFTLIFNDSSSNYVDGVGAHTVDGQEIATFKFDKKDEFTPIVTVSGIDFVPLGLEPIVFETLVTPEFPVGLVGLGMAGVVISLTIVFKRKIVQDR
jgi:plastocyanin